MRHLEEGEIHTWLDGALGAEESVRVEAHVASCAACSTAVAEARGLIAGASRILLALDNVPGGVLPARTAGPAGSFKRYQGDTNATRRHRVPWYTRRPLQIAAGLMLAAGLGSVVVRDAGRTSQTVKVDFETSSPVSALPLELDTAAPARVADVATVSGAPATPAPMAERQVQEAAASAQRDRVETPPPAIAAAKVAAPPIQPPTEPPAATMAAGMPRPAPGAISPTAGDARESFVAGGRARREAPQAGGTVGLAAGAPGAAGVAGAVGAAADPSAPGTISGRVVTTSNAPVGQALVTIPGSGVGAQTNADGTFTLPPLPPGSYTIEARRIGFAPARLDGVQLAAGDTARAQLAMDEALVQLSQVVIADAASTFGALAGSCFALDAESDAESRGVPVLPRRIRFRLATSAEPGRGVATDRAAVGGASAARRLPQAAASAEITSEPLTPLPWTRLGADSIVVTWQRTTDMVTFRLALRGDDVRGRATTNEALARSATVVGRRLDCGGGR